MEVPRRTVVIKGGGQDRTKFPDEVCKREIQGSVCRSHSCKKWHIHRKKRWCVLHNREGGCTKSGCGFKHIDRRARIAQAWKEAENERQGRNPDTNEQLTTPKKKLEFSNEKKESDVNGEASGATGPRNRRHDPNRNGSNGQPTARRKDEADDEDDDLVGSVLNTSREENELPKKQDNGLDLPK